MGVTPGRAVTGRDVVAGFALFLLTSSIPVSGVMFGREQLKNIRGPEPIFQSFCHYDSLYYQSICERGYAYHPALNSDVAFFPAYPLLARAVRFLTGCRTEWALLVVTYLSLAGCFVVFHAYARERCPSGLTAFPGYAVVAFGLFPTTCFFRFAYSESLFFLISVTALLGMSRRWPLWAVAFVIGLATTTRPVGVALLPPFVLYLWQRSESVKQFAARLAAYGPIACWGLLVYMAYLDWAFGEPFAFALTQDNWRMRPRLPLGEKLWKLLTLEPLWWQYTGEGRTPWPNDNPLFSLPVANPAFFVGAFLIVVWGACRRWLDAREVLLAAGLLVIPYVTRGYDNGLSSMGRFVAVIPGIYLVMAGWHVRVPHAVAAAVLALSACLLAAYSAEFAVWSFVF